MFGSYRIASPYPSLPERILGPLSISRAAEIASFLGLSGLGDLYRLLEGNGCTIEAGFPSFRLDIPRDELLAIPLRDYGHVSKYRLAGMIPSCRESQLYRMLSKENRADVEIASLFRLLPRDRCRASLLDEIDGYAAYGERIEPAAEGISSAVVVITGLMMKASGYGDPFTRASLRKAIKGGSFNPRFSTFIRCASFWGMPLRRLAIASESDALCLEPMPHLKDGDNSRKAVTERVCGGRTRAEVIKLFDEWYEEAAARQLSNLDVDPYLSTLTMFLEKVEMKLSDVLEEVEI